LWRKVNRAKEKKLRQRKKKKSNDAGVGGKKKSVRKKEWGLKYTKEKKEKCGM